jgi:hypothetical protein
LLVHDAPVVQVMHCPEPSQTLLVPHIVPPERFVAASRQRPAPVEQSTTPFLHAVGLFEHAMPASQAAHAPAAEQT